MFVFHLKTDHRIDSRVAMSTKSDNKTDKTDDKTADKTDKKSIKPLHLTSLLYFACFRNSLTEDWLKHQQNIHSISKFGFNLDEKYLKKMPNNSLYKMVPIPRIG